MKFKEKGGTGGRRGEQSETRQHCDFFCARAPEEAVTHLNFTAERVVAEAALFLSFFPIGALTGQSFVVSHGVPME
jgi:hypothetical protein